MIDPNQLEQAFALFNEASAQLTGKYHELQQQAGRLTVELAVANGELRRQYLEKQRLSERLKLLLDALPGAVVVLDMQGRVAEANPAAHLLLGDELTGMAWDELQRRHLRQTTTAQEWECTVPGGSARRVSMVESSLDADGGRILLLRDITEAWDMRQQLERHQRLSALGEMAAGLAHQLRTPLATALLYAANLSRPDVAEHDRSRFAQRIAERLRHLEQMIRDMLQFVRGEAVATEPVSVTVLLEELVQVMEPQMRQRQVELRVHELTPGSCVGGNRKALLGAILNLLENAMLACDAGGCVELSAHSVADRIEIQVADNGGGMPVAVRERLFEPFFSTRADGTGLGLSVVKSVVQAHGGDVRVATATGHGSTFIVTLPALAAVAAQQFQFA